MKYMPQVSVALRSKGRMRRFGKEERSLTFSSNTLFPAILSMVILAIGDSNNVAPVDGMAPLVLLWLVTGSLTRWTKEYREPERKSTPSWPLNSSLLSGIGSVFGYQTSYAINPARDLGKLRGRNGLERRFGYEFVSRPHLSFCSDQWTLLFLSFLNFKVQDWCKYLPEYLFYWIEELDEVEDDQFPYRILFLSASAQLLPRLWTVGYGTKVWSFGDGYFAYTPLLGSIVGAILGAFMVSLLKLKTERHRSLGYLTNEEILIWPILITYLNPPAVWRFHLHWKWISFEQAVGLELCHFLEKVLQEKVQVNREPFKHRRWKIYQKRGGLIVSTLSRFHSSHRKLPSVQVMEPFLLSVCSSSSSNLISFSIDQTSLLMLSRFRRVCTPPFSALSLSLLFVFVRTSLIPSYLPSIWIILHIYLLLTL